jgi:hypothetical protein
MPPGEPVDPFAAHELPRKRPASGQGPPPALGRRFAAPDVDEGLASPLEASASPMEGTIPMEGMTGCSRVLCAMIPTPLQTNVVVPGSDV